MLRKVGRFLFSPIRHWRITLTIVIGLAIAYKVADQVLLGKLAAQRESILAAGGHLSLRDFDLKIDEGTNAAVVYEYAASLAHGYAGPPAKETEDARSKWEDAYGRYIGASGCAQLPTPEEEARLGNFFAANARVFEAIEEACARPSCQFGEYDAPPEILSDPGAVSAVLLPKLAPIRELARLSAFRAVWEGRHGNPAGAYHWLTVGLHLANDTNNDPLSVAGLVGTAGKSTMVRALNVLLCELPLPDPVPADFMAELAVAADRSKTGIFFEGERCFADTITSYYKGMFPRPLLVLNQMACLDLETEAVNIMREQDDQLHARQVARFSAEVGPAGHKSSTKPGFVASFLVQHRILADILRPALGGAMITFDKGIGMARAGQVAVALKQYKQARGEYPADLAALAPDYLQNIPADPFTGSPPIYRREGDGFVVYSVGADGRDDGGEWEDRKKDLGLSSSI
ncbi:MAG TPA: hypothetical protein VMZ06_12380 [Candidatus Bathyarchaeia archaeon]|nr:hypothetical protein [Candidatus Bathyarchaeia archaeon]